ncbi:MAG: pentapeptide repeat-containing protein [Alphaproteobacteria bacterium]|nr:pentapeptide repeat-containing protein [Alphaproteobacteria bacterium]
MTGKDGWNNDGSELAAFTAGVQQRLRRTTVTEPADLRGFVFPPNFDFREFFVGEKHHVNFSLATFGDGADFSGVVFGDYADFSSANFMSGGNFHKATFGAMAIFRGARFGYFPNFEGAIFGFIGEFRDSIFVNAANFSKAKFHGYTNFSADAEFRDINFSDAKFKRHCFFNNRAFVTGGSFNGAVFEGLVEFHGCKFHQGMSFHETRFLKTKGEKRGTQKDINERTERLERSYRTLKLKMEELRARNEEAMFFALEMECRRNRGDVPRIERIAAMLYKHLSDYGQSIRWPLSWLGGVTVIMGSIYFYLLWATFSPAPTDIWGGAPKVKSVVAFTVEQMFRPFYVWSKDSAGIRLNLFDDSALLIPLLASLQSLATLSLLALFLLALRRRFKMD